MNEQVSENQSKWLQYSGSGLITGAGIGMIVGFVNDNSIIGLMIGAGIGLVFGSVFGLTKSTTSNK